MVVVVPSTPTTVSTVARGMVVPVATVAAAAAAVLVNIAGVGAATVGVVTRNVAAQLPDQPGGVCRHSLRSAFHVH